MQNKVSEGKVLMLTAATAVKAGALVVNGTLAGVAVDDIAAGATGACDTDGVFELPVKGEGPSANAAVAFGARLYYDAGVINVDNTNGVDVGLKACDAVASGATTTIKVRLKS